MPPVGACGSQPNRTNSSSAMSRKRQEIIVPDVTVTDAGAEGIAIVRIDGMVVFVPYVVPGDVIDLKIYK